MLYEIKQLKAAPQRIKRYPIDVLRRLLSHYPDPVRLQWFLEVCTVGTRIHLDPLLPLPAREFPVQPSWSWAEKVGVYSAFLKWHRTACLIGPVPYDPTMTISMIFSVPKPDGTYRGILNLSDASSTHISVNNCIHEDYKHVTYIQHLEIITKMQAIGTEGFLWVKDIVDGFHNLPVHADDLHHLGIRFHGDIYKFQRLPMGLSSSPALFTKFMHFPIWAASHDKDIDSDNLYFATIDSRVFDISVFRDDADITQIGSSHFYIWCLMDSYVDDIFGLASSETASLRQWSHSEKIFSAMNLSCKVAKGKLPAQVNVFLGKEYDLRRQWVRLSDGKLAKYIHFYTYVLTLLYIPEKLLLSVIGKGRHVASIYRCLNAFARGIESFIPYAARHGRRLGKGPPIRSSALLRSRLRLLMDCMLISNRVGAPFSHFTKPKCDTFDFVVICDASINVGLGGIISDGSFFQARWDSLDLKIRRRAERDIQFRELLAIYGAIVSLSERYGDKLLDNTIHVHTDNTACQFMCRSFSAKLARADLQILLNHICLICVRKRIHLHTSHIKGELNTIADALSRFYDNPLQFPTLPEYDLGPMLHDRSTSVHRCLQKGADSAASFLAENNLIIQKRHQEFPADFVDCDV